jgi:CDP-diacylglycerol---glycerol-3-phosphate 3-phosphatidyltransferase
MSASPSRAGLNMPRRPQPLPVRLKEAGRRLLSPVVRAALAIGLTANTVTVIGLGVVVIASLLVAQGLLLAGAAVMLAGTVLDAVDGSLARASGGTTPFGAFLDSTLDRIAEITIYTGIAVYFLASRDDPTLPVLAVLVALGGSFMVSYARARAEAMGTHGEVGIAARPERLMLIMAGLALAGLGWEVALIGALWVIGGFSLATVVQRIWHVWRQTGAVRPPQARTDTEEKAEHRG